MTGGLLLNKDRWRNCK